MSQSPSRSAGIALVHQQLRHPLKLRIVLTLSIIGAWYFLVFMPLGEQTQMTAARITREKKRIATARQIEALNKALTKHTALIPTGANLSDLMRRVIDHLRSSPLKLIDLKPESSKNLGPYETLGIQLTLEGQFAEIDAFLGWVETDENHMRVDSIRLDPNQQRSGRLKAQLTLLSLTEKPSTPAKPKAEASKTKPARSRE
jgi:Tfp pilus assembly protein PilO